MALVEKLASLECTCGGQGTCGACRVKQALARNTGGALGETVDEEGQGPDAPTLAIGT